ncbi:hypothetical protein BJ973_005689 [Actinoplanes tereljensis]|uniref:Uncharacterized protein n=1 Tax=Paractinoplanes tereljensis TaxID=571912 RepID=A0A919TZJ3_9ACTN|nr:hypothetical protein [Actinoplanes tereljensis]GIF26330.1 hypothetical protein Ate02nite_90600 [Actinoplanes tereljensis]
MFEEFVAAVASALSTQGSALVVAGGKSALKNVYEIVRARFGHATPAADGLDAALQQPGDIARIEVLARYLATAMAEDPAFAQQVTAAWQGATAHGSADGSAVVNNFSGQAQQVIQTRSIHGGIKF